MSSSPLQSIAHPAIITNGDLPQTSLVAARHGLFYVLDNDRLVSLSLLYYGELGQVEFDFMQRFIKAGDVVCDIGANLGGFTVPFAKAVGSHGHVHAFEPQPVLFKYLQANCEVNKLSHVTLHACCLGSAETMLVIDEPDYNQEGNFSGQPFKEEGFWEVKTTDKKITAPCHRLDNFFKADRLNFMKIDVEGMEFDVLQGAAHTITTHRPVLYFENNRVAHSPAIMRWLLSHNYKIWWHTTPFFNPANFNGRPENVFGQMRNINMIALPDNTYLNAIPSTLIPATNPDHHIREVGGRVQLSE